MMDSIGKTIILTGKTGHGKNIIKLRGKLWVIKDIDSPLCCDGIAFLIRPAGREGDDFRWVNQENDKNFEVQL